MIKWGALALKPLKWLRKDAKGNEGIEVYRLFRCEEWCREISGQYAGSVNAI